MGRIKRLVIPGYPHHVTQRGNRRQPTFFCPRDYEIYLRLISAAKERADLEIWAYCLMPNHVHFVIVPFREDSLAKLFGDAHRQYTKLINARNDWRGHLWQERFRSFVMDETHLMAAVRYVETNPTRANLCKDAENWPWSSVRAHLAGRDDALVSVKPMLQRSGNWRRYLGERQCDEKIDAIHQHSSTGRPAGSEEFVASLEKLTGRRLRREKPGRKKVQPNHLANNK